MRQRGWLHLLIPVGCWLKEFPCDNVEWIFEEQSFAISLSNLVDVLFEYLRVSKTHKTIILFLSRFAMGYGTRL